MSELKEKIGKLDQFKYPLIVLILGIVLMVFPGKSLTATADVMDKDVLLQTVLSSSEGVGDARVIVSENGVVVVCRGADDAKVRLDIIRAIASYTGFGSDKITILKMAD